MEIQVYVSQILGQAALFLPFGYSFGAGMLSAVNPCGFAMLPVYLSLYLGVEDESFSRRSVVRRIAQSVWVSFVVACGFGLLFGIVGGIVSAGGAFLNPVMPWISVIVAFLLVVLGLFLLGGRHISLPFVLQFAGKIGDPRHISLKGFFLFGLAFGATSLSCTFPIFLAIVGSSLAAGDFLTGLLQFVSYIAGMGTVLLILTIGIAFVKEGVVVGAFRKIMPYVEKVSAILLLIAGGYIMYYWLSSGLLV
ncbi:MAG: cytochrome C biogenesis protein [Desulfobacterales bacterium]|nr:MAG: cytochrome C biogenesis protein [Desulfobacterales bacterium]